MPENDIPIPKAPEFVSTKQIGNLVSQSEKEKQELENFIIIIWTINPNKDSVRVILNDGSIKLWMRREKFMKVIKDLLGPFTHELEYTIFRFQQSMNSYGLWFFYDRPNNIFKEIGFQPDFEHINPLELLKETKKSLVKEKLQDNFKEIINESNKMQDAFVVPKQSAFLKFFQTVKNFTKHEKKSY